jgi:hypothetical protein
VLVCLAEQKQSKKVVPIGFHRDISRLSKFKKKNTVCQCRSFPNNHIKFSGKVKKKRRKFSTQYVQLFPGTRLVNARKKSMNSLGKKKTTFV